MDYSFFDYMILVIVGLIGGYIFVRVVVFGGMKSIYQAKIWFLNQLKGGKDNDSSK